MKKNNEDTTIYNTSEYHLHTKEDFRRMVTAEYYARNLKELKEEIQCPELGSSTYGKLSSFSRNRTLVFIINELIKVVEGKDNQIQELWALTNKNEEKYGDYLPIIWECEYDDEDSEEHINK